MWQSFRYNVNMKIVQSIYIKDKINQLSQTQTFNIALAHQTIDYILSNPPSIKKTNLVKKMNDQHLSEIEAYESLLLSKFLKDPVIKQHPNLLALSLKSHLRLLDPASLISNPFYQRVKPRPFTQGKWQLGYETYLPFQGVLTGDVITNPIHHYLETTPLGYFLGPFYYLVIKQQAVTWMSVTPFEINTMAPVIDNMRGNVITLGLGLGYFASMVALKPEVSEVLVIEKNQQVIEIFLKHIYPNLENKEKIKIHHEDAFDYLRNNTRSFDHLFVDIHHTADDGLPMYIRMKKLEKITRSGQWHYWLESSILSLFRRYMIVFLEEQLLSFDDSKYQNPITLEDYLYRELYQLNKDTSISSLQELDRWLSKASIQSLLTEIDLPDDVKE
jgi:hypothetical protein